jgi:hypothetical protein
MEEKRFNMMRAEYLEKEIEFLTTMAVDHEEMLEEGMHGDISKEQYAWHKSELKRFSTQLRRRKNELREHKRRTTKKASKEKAWSHDFPEHMTYDGKKYTYAETFSGTGHYDDAEAHADFRRSQYGDRVRLEQAVSKNGNVVTHMYVRRRNAVYDPLSKASQRKKGKRKPKRPQPKKGKVV